MRTRIAMMAQGAEARSGPLRRVLDLLLNRWRGATLQPRRLALIERIALGPRHTLSLVEAEGVSLLVATSAEGATTVFPLAARFNARVPKAPPGRVSW
jgi:hypothetical protein